MRRALLICCLILWVFQSTGQLTNEYQTLKNNKGALSVDWMVTPMIDVSATPDHFVLFAGAGIAALLNDRFYLGLVGYSALGGINPDGYEDPDYYSNYFEYGGLWAGYIFNPKQIIHAAVDVKLGYGNLAIGEGQGEEFLNFGVYVLKPAFELEMNLNDHFKIGCDFHYRIATPVPLYITESASLSGPGLGLTFKYVRRR